MRFLAITSRQDRRVATLAADFSGIEESNMTDIGFGGKVTIITGAGGGLGRSHALELARRGARVVVNDLGGSVDGTGASLGPAALGVEEIQGLRREGVGNTGSA